MSQIGEDDNNSLDSSNISNRLNDIKDLIVDNGDMDKIFLSPRQAATLTSKENLDRIEKIKNKKKGKFDKYSTNKSSIDNVLSLNTESSKRDKSPLEIDTNLDHEGSSKEGLDLEKTVKHN